MNKNWEYGTPIIYSMIIKTNTTTNYIVNKKLLVNQSYDSEFT